MRMFLCINVDADAATGVEWDTMVVLSALIPAAPMA